MRIFIAILCLSSFLLCKEVPLIVYGDSNTIVFLNINGEKIVKEKIPRDIATDFCLKPKRWGGFTGDICFYSSDGYLYVYSLWDHNLQCILNSKDVYWINRTCSVDDEVVGNPVISGINFLPNQQKYIFEIKFDYLNDKNEVETSPTTIVFYDRKKSLVLGCDDNYMKKPTIHNSGNYFVAECAGNVCLFDSNLKNFKNLLDSEIFNNISKSVNLGLVSVNKDIVYFFKMDFKENKRVIDRFLSYSFVDNKTEEIWIRNNLSVNFRDLIVCDIYKELILLYDKHKCQIILFDMKNNSFKKIITSKNITSNLVFSYCTVSKKDYSFIKQNEKDLFIKISKVFNDSDFE